jgi:hypothetical protein
LPQQLPLGYVGIGYQPQRDERAWVRGVQRAESGQR